MLCARAGEPELLGAEHEGDESVVHPAADDAAAVAGEHHYRASGRSDTLRRRLQQSEHRCGWRGTGGGGGIGGELQGVELVVGGVRGGRVAAGKRRPAEADRPGGDRQRSRHALHAQMHVEQVASVLDEGLREAQLADVELRDGGLAGRGDEIADGVFQQGCAGHQADVFGNGACPQRQLDLVGADAFAGAVERGDAVVVLLHRHIGGGVDEGRRAIGAADQVGGGGGDRRAQAAVDLVTVDGSTAVLRYLPAQLRAFLGACAGQAGVGRCAWLGAVVLGVERLAGNLPHDLREGGIGVLRRIEIAAAHAAVGVAVHRVAVLVDGDLVEVEQVAVGGIAAGVPDAADALHDIVGRGVDGDPALAAVVGGREVDVPEAGEVRRHRIALGRGADIGTRCTVGVARDGVGEHHVLEAHLRTQLDARQPGPALVLGDTHHGASGAVGVAEVAGVVGCPGDRGISDRGDRARHLADRPGAATVLADGDGDVGAAGLARHRDGAIRRHAHMAVDARTVVDRVDGHRLVEGQPAVVGACAAGEGDVLPAVIEGVGKDRQGKQRRQAGGIGAGGDGLVIGGRQRRAALVRRPALAAIVGEAHRAVDADQLADPDAAAVLAAHQRVRHRDGVERGGVGDRRGAVLPAALAGLRQRRGRVLRELEPQRAQAGEDEGELRVRAVSDRGLALVAVEFRRRDVLLVARHPRTDRVGPQARTAAVHQLHRTLDDAVGGRRRRDAQLEVTGAGPGRKVDGLEAEIAAAGHPFGRRTGIEIVDGEGEQVSATLPGEADADEGTGMGGGVVGGQFQREGIAVAVAGDVAEQPCRAAGMEVGAGTEIRLRHGRRDAAARGGGGARRAHQQGSGKQGKDELHDRDLKQWWARVLAENLRRLCKRHRRLFVNSTRKQSASVRAAQSPRCLAVTAAAGSGCTGGIWPNDLETEARTCCLANERLEDGGGSRRRGNARGRDDRFCGRAC